MLRRFGGVLPVVLPDEVDGVDGVVTTIDKTFSKLRRTSPLPHR